MNMTKAFLAATLLAILAVAVQADTPPMPPSGRESIEWCDIWISHASETNLPRVLLIGDSIARAYFPEVEKKTGRPRLRGAIVQFGVYFGSHTAQAD
jgi:hypothetical protein